MKRKIAIIGKYSYIGSNLTNSLKKKKDLNVKSFSFEKFLKIKKLNNFDYIINTAINKKITKQIYNAKNDIDLIISKKIYKLDIKQILLSSRKVYPEKFDIKENSIPKPQNLYARNKIKSEKKCLRLMKKKLLILRLSNLIGGKIRYNRKVTNNFYENFLYFSKKNFYVKYEDSCKDFLSMVQFIDIIYKLIQKEIIGTFNLSLGKKVYVSEIISWLDYYKGKKNIEILKNTKNQGFYLNNLKLLKKIKYKIHKKDLKNYCIKLSKKIFKKK